ncbi:type II secretion system protein GspD [Albitalea terrae]|uniref:Type II secretion system protein GspD n=2 Tax=Piscinibacter terrae TaxID=2496871 RepID=A0A3N7HWU5_9BURK|nr:type II secretion system protein GspD [Albitalea terrae]
MPRRLGTRSLAAVLCLSLAMTPASFAQSPNAKFKGEPVTLNFVNADIEGVTRAMAAILKQQFVVDPRVKGTITLYSEEPLLPREAYLNFLAALRGLGFTVVESGGIYKVVPEADAKLQAGTVSVGGVDRRGDQVITQIFKLNHESANNMVPVLRPLISPNNTINANPGNNSLVITDYADNLNRIAKIIAAMDTPAAGDVEVIPLQHAVASDLAVMVQRLTESSPGAPNVPGVSGTGASILVDPRSNSLLVRAPNPARMAAIRSLVEKLDKPIPGNNPMGNIWVVYLKNADAVKLASVLRAAYGAGGGASSGGSSSTGSSSTSGAVPPTQNAQGAGAGASPQSTAPITPSAGPSTGGFVQADPSTNSLIITAPEPMYRQLRSVIDQLDSRRAQVYIESMIIKVDATKAAEFGFQFQGPLNSTGSKTVGVAGTNYNVAQNGANNIIPLAVGIGTGSATPPGVGLNVGLLRQFGGVYTLTALAHFLETKTDGNILSTPNLVTLDNEEAKIVIGQNVPFITGSFTNTGTSGSSANPFQTIERKDVGLTLRIKPQVGEGGTVRMTIYQENSSVDASSKSSPQGLTTDKSAIETNVVVDDGQIMVLGGLLKDEYSGGVSKVPVLGDIPVLGNLFKTDTRSRTKSNLMVFLRPIIVRTQDASNALTMDRYDAIRGLQQNTQPNHSIVVPVNEAPVIPPIQTLIPPPAPASGPAPTAAPAASAPMTPQTKK